MPVTQRGSWINKHIPATCVASDRFSPRLAWTFLSSCSFLQIQCPSAYLPPSFLFIWLLNSPPLWTIGAPPFSTERPIQLLSQPFSRRAFILYASWLFPWLPGSLVSLEAIFILFPVIFPGNRYSSSKCKQNESMKRKQDSVSMRWTLVLLRHKHPSLPSFLHCDSISAFSRFPW